MNEQIVILDFGSQYTQVIARRIRECNVYSVILRYDTAVLELEITDTGTGSAPGGIGTGHGLIGMRERTTLLGGDLVTGSRDGGGYLVRARLPLTGANGAQP